MTFNDYDDWEETLLGVIREREMETLIEVVADQEAVKGFAVGNCSYPGTLVIPEDAHPAFRKAAYGAYEERKREWEHWQWMEQEDRRRRGH